MDQGFHGFLLHFLHGSGQDFRSVSDWCDVVGSAETLSGWARNPLPVGAVPGVAWRGLGVDGWERMRHFAVVCTGAIDAGAASAIALVSWRLWARASAQLVRPMMLSSCMAGSGVRVVVAEPVGCFCGRACQHHYVCGCAAVQHCVHSFGKVYGQPVFQASLDDAGRRTSTVQVRRPLDGPLSDFRWRLTVGVPG